MRKLSIVVVFNFEVGFWEHVFRGLKGGNWTIELV